MALRGVLIFGYYMAVFDLMGFWKAVGLHFVYTPLDMLLLVVLAIWGSLALGSTGGASCALDPACAPFMQPTRLNVLLSFNIIIFSCCVLPCLVGFFFTFLGGWRMYL